MQVEVTTIQSRIIKTLEKLGLISYGFSQLITQSLKHICGGFTALKA